MSDSDVTARIKAQRERVLDELKTLDELYVEAGIIDSRQPVDMLTHCVAITSWHRMDVDGDLDSSSLTHYRLTDMAPWQMLGMLEAQSSYTRHDLLHGDVDD